MDPLTKAVILILLSLVPSFAQDRKGALVWSDDRSQQVG